MRRDLHIWRAELDSGRWASADGLPAVERERAAELREGVVRDRWVAARWALRGVLARYLDEDPAAIELALGEKGKPCLADPSAALQFNLSHSGELAAVAVSDELEVGIDVERVRSRRNLPELARRALSADEAAAVEAKAPDELLAAFHAAWTRREAIAKCFGIGIAAPLPDAPVTVSQLDLVPGYATAIAVAGNTLPPPRLFDLAPADPSDASSEVTAVCERR